MLNSKIILNLIPIKKGGGQQVATNFINVLHNEKCFGYSFVFLVTKNTFIEKELHNLGFQNIISVEDSLSARLKFEYFELNKIAEQNKASVVFTLFGPGLPKLNVPAVVGSAYSNIFFPEINFWNQYSFLKRIRLRVKDLFRLKRTLASGGIIFENAAMRNRAIKLFNYPAEKTIFIPPSISFQQDENTEVTVGFDAGKIKPGFNILILSGWHKNKNIDKVPYILSEFKNRTFKVNFVLTVDSESPDSKLLVADAQRLGVEDRITFLGQIKPNDVKHLFEKVDALMLLSLLESFSNNIIECWYYKKPLIISDLEWAREICKDAAVYVPRDEPRAIAEKITKLSEDKDFYQSLVTKGQIELVNYPTPTQKVKLQLDFLKQLISNA